MATNTKNYGFKKPDESDFYSIQDQNGNWDKVDKEMGNLDSPSFEDYTSGESQVPDAAAALAGIKSKSKLGLLFSNIKAFCKGCCTLGMIVDNCVTDNPNLPGSAKQLKILMDLYTQLNSEVIQNSGSVKAEKGTDNSITTIKIKAGHRYIIFGKIVSTMSDSSSIMNCEIQLLSGTANTTGGDDVRTTMNSGGGCVNWMYADAKTDCTIILRAYGYSSVEYSYVGLLLAIQLR